MQVEEKEGEEESRAPVEFLQQAAAGQQQLGNCLGILCEPTTTTATTTTLQFSAELLHVASEPFRKADLDGAARDKVTLTDHPRLSGSPEFFWYRARFFLLFCTSGDFVSILDGRSTAILCFFSISCGDPSRDVSKGLAPAKGEI